jgi:hypothetical protein
MSIICKVDVLESNELKRFRTFKRSSGEARRKDWHV